MYNIKIISLVVSFLWLLSFGVTTHAEQNIKKKVLLVGFDGVRNDTVKALIENGDLPSLSMLARRGLLYRKATTSDLTGSWGGWSDALRGVHRDMHEAGYWGENGVPNVSPGPEHPDIKRNPDIFLRIEKHDQSYNTAMFNTWEGLQRVIVSPDHKAFINYEKDGDRKVTQLAVDYLLNSDPDLVFFYQGDTDIAGHTSKFGPNRITDKVEDFPAQYRNTLKVADSNLGKLLSAIENRPEVISGVEQWLVIFTSDHGGTQSSHSKNLVAERNIPFIVSGINWRIPCKNCSPLIQAKNIDIIPTVLNFLDIQKTSIAWDDLTGHSLLESMLITAPSKPNENLVINGGGEYDQGFNGHDGTIGIGKEKDHERDWLTEGLYWDQAVSGWDDWTISPSGNSINVVYYGANNGDHYPDKKFSELNRAGNNFFSGGISGPGSMTQKISLASFPAEDQGYTVEISSLLGGSGSYDDRAILTANFIDKRGNLLKSVTLHGPSAKDRKSKIELLYRFKKTAMPKTARNIILTLNMEGKYGFADNITIKLMKNGI